MMGEEGAYHMYTKSEDRVVLNDNNVNMRETVLKAHDIRMCTKCQLSVAVQDICQVQSLPLLLVVLEAQPATDICLTPSNAK